MGYVLPPIPKDLFLKRILKVIMEDTFNELTAHLLELHFLNTD